MPRRFTFPSIYRLGQLGLDGLVAVLACSFAFLIRFEGNIPVEHQMLAWILPLIAVPARLLTHTGFGLYQQVWRLFGVKDTLRVCQSVTFYSLIVLVVTRLFIPRFLPFQGIALSIAVIDWSFCLMGMVALRYSRRWSAYRRQLKRHLEQKTSQKQQLLLVGAGVAGAQVVKELQENPQVNLEVVGFLDDDTTKVRRKVEGVPVLGRTAQLLEITERLGVTEVLITMPSAQAHQIRRLVDLTHGTDLKLKVLPSSAEVLRDRSLTPQARDIQIRDLLGRPEIHLDFSEEFSPSFPSAQAQINQKVVLVTGAGGTIGSEICRQIARLKPQTLLLLGRGENSIFHIDQELKQHFPNIYTVPLIADIRHQGRMQQLFKAWQPDVVFHAAAHKHVPLMQDNPTEALENNSLASNRLAEIADRFGVSTFVLISTDKAVDPSNFMGLSKRLAELMVKAFSTKSQTRFLVVRFGNVLGSRGSVVPIFQQQIARGGPVTVTDPSITRYFMTVPEAAKLVVQSLAVGKSGQTMILDMGEPVKIIDLAEQMIRLAGLKLNEDISIRITGLRPGEKLHESLICSMENVSPTVHPKLMAVSGQTADLDILLETISILSEITVDHLPPKQLWQAAHQCKIRLEEPTPIKSVEQSDWN